jgi:alkylation response protein AidB-like acyl-CoA dehydrogenase
VIDLGVNEEQGTLIELVHGFAERELRRMAKEAEKAGSAPDSVSDALHALGVACPVPESLGGQGVPDLVTALMLAEELAWGDPGIAQAALGAGHVAALLALCAAPPQQQRLLPRFLGAKPLAASVLYYEGFGRQPSELRTRAERTPSGWRLTGEKRFVLHPGSAALGVIVAARADTGSLGAFLLEGVPRGLRVTRDDREVGKIGLAAAHTGNVAFDGLEVPGTALLGDGDPLALARAIAWLRLSVPAQALGCARAALEFARHYATERVAFGRPISAFQGVAFPLVDQDMAVDAARIELWEIARAVWQSDDARLIERLTGTALARCCEAALQATREALQTLGGHGFITEYPVERWYRCAAALSAIDFDPHASTVSFL